MFYQKSLAADAADGYTDINSKEGNLGLAIVFWVMAFFTVCYICCMYKRIKLAVAVIKVIFFKLLILSILIILNSFFNYNWLINLLINIFDKYFKA